MYYFAYKGGIDFLSQSVILKNPEKLSDNITVLIDVGSFLSFLVG